MNKLILILLTQSAFGFSSKPPVVEPTPSPTILPVPAPSVSPIPGYDPMQSACAKYSWKNRGKAPAGYIKGLVEMYKLHACDKAPSLGGGSTDALAWYEKDASMLNTYTLLIGLGMRESSGEYCTGRDTSAGPETASEAETGLYQFSFNSVGADSKLKDIVSFYKAHPEKCLLNTFKEGVSCRPQGIVGTGPGADFQVLGKSCPAFAVEYASLLIRKLRKHFGPLNRKEAEFNESCRQMFLNVKGECK